MVFDDGGQAVSGGGCDGFIVADGLGCDVVVCDGDEKLYVVVFSLVMLCRADCLAVGRGDGESHVFACVGECVVNGVEAVRDACVLFCVLLVHDCCLSRLVCFVAMGKHGGHRLLPR